MALRQVPLKQDYVDKTKLADFGFKQEGQTHVFSTLIMEEAFRVELQVNSEGDLFSRVIDNDLQEDYLPIWVKSASNPYAKKVRAAYQQVIRSFRTSCCKHLPFTSDQMNRINQKIIKRYGDVFDQPFEKGDSYRSFRVAGKWYALVYSLDVSKLVGIPKTKAGQILQVANVKVNAKHLDSFLLLDGVYPAYHMSKKSWVTILLDDSLSDAVVWDFFDNSRALVAPSLLSNPNGSDYWIIPANLKYYDIDAEFAASKEILWTQKAGIKAGDYVFIYITAPTKAIRYACKVLEANLQNNGYRNRDGIDYLMRLELLEQYTDDKIPFDIMKVHAVTAVRGPRRMSPQLRAFLAEKEYFKEN
ncbi:MmcQ/YjbR family DNA-binding protein [Streptococcus iniae]